MTTSPVPSASSTVAEPTALTAPQLEILKLAVAATEGHLRAFDTKAQITLAAFVLSLNPLWAIFHSGCSRGIDTRAAVALLVVIMITIVAYGAVVWPAAHRRSRGRPGAFFLPGTADAPVDPYLAELRSMDIGRTFAEEALKLALASTVLAYGVLFGLFVSGSQCA